MSFSFFNKPSKGNSQWSAIWTELSKAEQLDMCLSQTERPVLIFKHSTRCIISKTVLKNFESEWSGDKPCELVLLDLLAHRELSNQIAEELGVIHQSPQAILIRGNKVLHQASHQAISAQAIEDLLSD